MEVVGSSTRPQLQEKEENSSKAKGNDFINVYDEAPTVEMSLDQFEVYALKRLKVGRLLVFCLTCA